ncbi:MAG: hypothetical protein KBT06_09630 [Prevotellaceae bacterium]|nr:hypothetical protein [Candidatus Colivivens equi]
MGVIHRYYRATIKRSTICNGFRFEPSMSVEFICPNFHEPLFTADGRQVIEEAFMRRYGVSLNKSDLLSPLWIKCEQI